MTRQMSIIVLCLCLAVVAMLALYRFHYERTMVAIAVIFIAWALWWVFRQRAPILWKVTKAVGGLLVGAGFVLAVLHVFPRHAWVPVSLMGVGWCLTVGASIWAMRKLRARSGRK